MGSEEMGSEDKEVASEVERLRRERDELQKQVETLEDRPAKRGRMRRIGAVVLVVLTVIVFAAGVAGAWARRTVLDTDRYVATVAPLTVFKTVAFVRSATLPGGPYQRERPRAVRSPWARRGQLRSTARAAGPTRE